MNIGYILAKEYVSLFGFLVLFAFVITNKKMEGSDKRLFYGVIITAITEIIVFEVEAYFGNLAKPTFMRVFLSAIGYLLRPTLVLMIILLVDKNLRTKKSVAILSIPLAICFICVSMAFYSHLCFWFSETNNFQRGILGYVPHAICILYTFICLIVACRLIKRRDRLDVYVLICASLCPVFAILLDSLVLDMGLSRISIMLCTLIMYIQSYSITINTMIDEIPGAIAKLEVKNGVCKVLSFNELLSNMFGLSYAEFTFITKDDPFAVLDEKSRALFEDAVSLLSKQDKYSFRFKILLLGKEKYINTSLRVSKRTENEVEIYVTMIDVTTEMQIFEELSIRNNEISLMIDQLGKIICIYDVPTRTLSMSEKYAKLRGFSSNKVIVPDETIERHLISDDYKQAYNNFYKKISAGERSGDIIAKFIESNGKERWEKTNFVVVATKDDKPLRAIITIEDITETYQEKLLLNKYKSTLDGLMGDKKYCLMFDLIERKVLAYEGKLLPSVISFDNKTIEEIVDYFVERNVKEQDKEIVRELYNADNMLISYYAGVFHRHIERIIVTSDGSERWFRLSVNLDCTSDNKIMATLLCEDIDDEYRTYNVLIARANYDFLTGALTRETTMDEIEKYLSGDGINGTHALVMMDMDNLKALNDNLGHQFGDTALKDFANKVKESINDDDFIGRIGGDEFFVFMKNVNLSTFAAKMKALIHSLEKTYSNRDIEVKVTASAGISTYYGDRTERKSLKEMYSQADFALYKSKVNGKNTYTFSDD